MGYSSVTPIRDKYRAPNVPDVFCWTKMGAEAGQPLDDILRRKELERLAGKGTFSWGIGNSLGQSVQQALQSYPQGLSVLFSPMKSNAKKLDQNPDEISLWMTYQNTSGEYVELPEHMIITSRRHTPSGAVKTNHYALLCFSEEPVDGEGYYGKLDASCAVNYTSKNALGASQVTAMVSYESPYDDILKPYPIRFRASFFQSGFVKLGSPVVLRGNLQLKYNALLNSTNEIQWKTRSRELKALIRDAT